MCVDDVRRGFGTSRASWGAGGGGGASEFARECPLADGLYCVYYKEHEESHRESKQGEIGLADVSLAEISLAEISPLEISHGVCRMQQQQRQQRVIASVDDGRGRLQHETR